ncbi:methyltransferase [uncultured Alistipes sp.]|jgi:tRNA (adenine-N(6)-)-methyltransferase|uniref:tRNA1(Val) (adenine(37)-N6)-methyltransferase n=1 Tax=uncultured Alistipes sp. TaxID=538949 RepID=UPI0025D0BE19|nr:methyltransferase [uncultured Alistipes sp.]
MFRFKHFTIRQDRCPMKVGTDGVLLGAWADVHPGDRNILDIGTGTGLIALMMAQRAPGAQIVGVDVEEVVPARENADASPWGGRVAFVQCPVQEFVQYLPVQERTQHPSLQRSVLFDLIVSNPPFFVDSLTSPDLGRTTARHAVLLPFDELRDSVVRLLSDKGRFAVILPAEEARRFISVCEGYLTLARRTDVCTTPRHAPKRVLMEFVRAGNGPAVPPQTTELTIGTGEHERYTPEYRALTRDFYLKF